MAKILLVEDNHSIVKALKYSLEMSGYDVSASLSYQESLIKIEEDYDLIILDIALPDGNGYDLCKKIKMTSNIPCLFLSAKDQEEDIVKGLELGAEDYITKPFGAKELLVRIDKIIKRQTKSKIVNINNIKLDLDKAQVFVQDKLINLTPLEYKIIHLLFTNLNRVITRETLMHLIWDVNDNFVNDNTLTVNIKRIREKLGNDSIKTVKGLGYMVETDEK